MKYYKDNKKYRSFGSLLFYKASDDFRKAWLYMNASNRWVRCDPGDLVRDIRAGWVLEITEKEAFLEIL